MISEEMKIVATHSLGGDELEKTNSKNYPENVKPTSLEKCEFSSGLLKASLPPVSWSVIELSV
jgi:alpha-N-arabinofuranosidase